MAKLFLTPIDLGGLELLNAVVQNLASAPSSPAAGQVYFDTGDETLYVWDGAAWVDLGEAGGVTDHGALTGLGDDDHTQYQLESEKGNANGYASLDGSGLVPDAQIPSGIARDTEVTAAINAVIDSAPGALDTLNELAAAIGDDASFATTVTNALAARTQKYAEDIGDGATTAIVVTHSLGTRDVHVQVYDAASFEQVICDVEHTSTNTVTLTFAEAPDTDAYRVVVIG